MSKPLSLRAARACAVVVIANNAQFDFGWEEPCALPLWTTMRFSWI